MILLDTTVLVYAVGDEHPLRAACRRVIAAHGDGGIQCGTTVEVIQEFAYARARRRSRADAARLARFYRRALQLEMTGSDDLELGLALFERYSALGSFDAVLAAVALNRGVEWLISADRSFASVSQLPWIDPAGPELDRLLPG